MATEITSIERGRTHTRFKVTESEPWCLKRIHLLANNLDRPFMLDIDDLV